jgi:hypothetical protein
LGGSLVPRFSKGKRGGGPLFKSTSKIFAEKERLQLLQGRVSSAHLHFSGVLKEFEKRVNAQKTKVESLKGTKKYVNELNELSSLFSGKNARMKKAKEMCS